jgi:hypothetical protein
MRAALAAPALALLLGLSTGGCGASDRLPTASTAGAPTPGWTVVHDRARGVRVAFPSSWHRARRSLTPHLADPREVLSVGTAPLTVTPGAHMPVGALSRLGPGDVLISVQEARHAGHGFPARPARFRLGSANLSEAAAYLSDPERLDTWFLPFKDGDRAFYALVAVGRPVAAARRRLAERVLDSLRFTPRRPQGAG